MKKFITLLSISLCISLSYAQNYWVKITDNGFNNPGTSSHLAVPSIKVFNGKIYTSAMHTTTIGGNPDTAVIFKSTTGNKGSFVPFISIPVPQYSEGISVISNTTDNSSYMYYNVKKGWPDTSVVFKYDGNSSTEFFRYFDGSVVKIIAQNYMSSDSVFIFTKNSSPASNTKIIGSVYNSSPNPIN